MHNCANKSVAFYVDSGVPLRAFTFLMTLILAIGTDHESQYEPVEKMWKNFHLCLIPKKLGSTQREHEPYLKIDHKKQLKMIALMSVAFAKCAAPKRHHFNCHRSVAVTLFLRVCANTEKGAELRVLR